MGATRDIRDNINQRCCVVGSIWNWRFEYNIPLCVQCAEILSVMARRREKRKRKQKMNAELINGFRASEFVPKSIFDLHGANNSWWFINPKVIDICAFMKERFHAPIIINNWRAGGPFSYRGYRPRTYNEGGENSQHRLGCAADVNIPGITSNEIRADILKNKDLYMSRGLTTLEDEHFAPTWVHFDIRPTGSNEIFIVKPIK